VSWNVILLAAGSSRRMRSNLPKILHKLAGITMLEHVARKCVGSDCTICVISEKIDSEFKDMLPCGLDYIIQDQPLGTGHAVRSVIEHLVGNKSLSQVFYGNKKTLILFSDTPLLSATLIEKLLKTLESDFKLAIASFLTNEYHQPYGRVFGDINPKLGLGTVDRIVEYQEALLEGSHETGVCNSGVMAIHTDLLSELIGLLDNRNASGEFYLTDLVSLARQRNIVCCQIMDTEETLMGVNSRSELSKAEAIIQNILRNKHMDAGVTLMDPGTVFFDMDVVIGVDTTISQGVCIQGKTCLGDRVVIDPYTNITDSQIGNDVVIGSHSVVNNSAIEDRAIIESHVVIKNNSLIGKASRVSSFSYIEGLKSQGNVTLGPFLRVRAGTCVLDNAKLGSFVEVKNSTIGIATKASHLAYIGDSCLGNNSNIGAGTIVCNYDGFHKHQTKIGDGVFIGANSCLVAPLKIGDGAIIGAGSVITNDVSPHALASSRVKQLNLPNGAKKYRSNRKA
jgi:bifunctional UDP-N-acetylglucosamine pyrophosphorylase / glucosamine-1-phosphate N-acetyltransferase